MTNIATIQKKYKNATFPGSMCIFTIAGGPYQYFAPLFVKLCKRAYPQYDCKVLVPGDMEIQKVPGIISAQTILPFQNPLMCAATRFLVSPEWLVEYDYCLITDVDMLIIQETPDIVSQHMMWMDICGTEYFNNWLMEPQRMPGVHFVRKGWWEITAKSRKAETEHLFELAANQAIKPHHDEYMLYRIARDSGLPPAGWSPMPWNHHGQHLGTLRDSWLKERKFHPSNQAACLQLLDDDLEKEVELATYRFPWIKELAKWLWEEYC